MASINETSRLGRKFGVLKVTAIFYKIKETVEKLMFYDMTALKSSMHASTEDTQKHCARLQRCELFHNITQFK